MKKSTMQQDMVLMKLKKVKMLEYLTPDEMKIFLESCELVQFEKGEKIIEQNKIHPYIYVILQGSAEVNVQKTEKRIFIANVQEGEIIGETGIFSDLPRTADVSAINETHMLQVPRRNFMNFIRRYPEAGNKILMYIIYSLIHRLKEANQELSFERQISLSQDEIDNFINYYMR